MSKSHHQMTLTKLDIIEKVSAQMHVSKKISADMVEAVFATITETLKDGEVVKLSGFGNFMLRNKAARTGRNPQTGDKITIEPRRVLSFKVSQVLKEAINEFAEKNPDHFKS